MNQDNNTSLLPQQDNNHEDEIDLLDLIGVLFKHKWLIISITGLAALYILIYSIISLKLPPEKSFLPNLYTPQSLV
ncbi:Wzz/FepE/Etk N-terminal domain-containing protein, partial [Oceanispirochaeta sp.]|uniref:Wzz/FepE/Etk N-terminal domain-containing protein n=1 Tax=Oceanispirochaeta sp. TaxID=2035350 RepID=UPI00261B9B3F